MSNYKPAAPRAIVPFWLRLRQISLYPAQLSVLSTIALYAGLRLLGNLPGIGGVVLTLIVYAALYKYASEVLVATAKGRMKAPEGWANDANGSGWVQVKLQILLVLMAVAGFMLLGPGMGMVALIFIGLATPGASMSAATDGDLWHALNPGTWVQIMGRLGWPYFVVAVLCAVIWISQVNAQAIVMSFLPGMLGEFVLQLIANYATVVTFHLMGYLIYQYHEELGWEVEDSAALKHPADVDQDLLDQAEALARDGNLQGAEDLLREQLTSRGGSPALHQRYMKLLALRGDTAAQLKHGRDFVNVLMALNQERKALDVMRDCLALDKSFQPSAPEFVHQLASRAAEFGLNSLAIDILAGFHRAFPRHGDTPKNYLLAAKLMAEKMNAEDKARAILNQVKQAFPTHPLLPEIDSYLKFLDALAAPKRAPAPI